MSMPFLLPLSLLFSLFLLSSCATYKPLKKDEISKEISFQLSTEVMQWWKHFHDPHLNHALQTALEDNLDLLTAKSTIKQAKYALISSKASLFPKADLSLGSSHSIDHTAKDVFYKDESSFSLQASYELDLWDHIHTLSNATLHTYREKQFDYQTIYITLSCDFVTTWYTLAYLEESKTLLRERLKLAKDEISLLKKHYLFQKAKQVDILSQQSEIKQIESELITLEYQIHSYKNVLNLFMGKKYETFLLKPIKKLPKKLPKTALKIPARVLFKRPDIRAAYEALKTEDTLSAAAVSAQYPHFSINSSFKNTKLSQLFEEWYLTLSSSLLTPIFDAGRLENDANLAIEKRKASLLQFKKLLLKASIEVSDALKALQTQKQLHTIIKKQLKIDQEKEYAYHMSYLHGTEDFKRYLDAKSALRATKEREISTRLKLIEAYITLTRVTASGWSIIQQEGKK